MPHKICFRSKNLKLASEIHSRNIAHSIEFIIQRQHALNGFRFPATDKTKLLSGVPYESPMSRNVDKKVLET
ncbi:hypothetical protein evm_001567 [Chilo suppressalis]|nr:hypothetical protein evm_001567 [Chilo suppressalis]